MDYDKRTLKAIGKILKMNKMGIIEDSKTDPLYSVWVYKGEIRSLLEGKMPEEWYWY